MPSFFHLAKLLDQHLLGNRRSSSLRLREAQDLAAEEMEQDEELSSSFEHFERLLHILSGGRSVYSFPLLLGVPRARFASNQARNCAAGNQPRCLVFEARGCNWSTIRLNVAWSAALRLLRQAPNILLAASAPLSLAFIPEGVIVSL
jgi:hypothetical protein